MRLRKDHYWNQYYIEEDGGGDFVGPLLTIVFIIVGIAAVLTLLKSGINWIAETLDIKSHAYVKMVNLPEDSGYNGEDFTLTLKSVKDGSVQYQKAFNKNGTAKLKTDPGEYVLSIGARNYQYILGAQQMNRIASYDYTYNAFYDSLGFVYYRFFDESGKQIYPDNVKLYSDSESAAPVFSDGYYLYLYAGYHMKGSATISADGYEPVLLDFEDLPQMSRANVILTEEGKEYAGTQPRYQLEDLSGQGEKLLNVWLYDGDNKTYREDDVSAVMENSTGTKKELLTLTNGILYTDIPEEGDWTITINADGYTALSRKMIVDHDSDVYITSFQMSKEEN